MTYADVLGLDLVAAWLLLVVALLAARSARRLGERDRLARAAGRARALVVCAAALMVARVATTLGLLSRGQTFGENWLYFEVPVLLAAAAGLLGLALPRLTALRRGQGDASDPLLVVPVRAAALAAAITLLHLYWKPPAVVGVALMAGFVAGTAALWLRWRTAPPRRLSRWRRVAAYAAIVVLASAGIAAAGTTNRLPERFDAMDHGTIDLGGGRPVHHADRALSLTRLAGPGGTPDRRFTLTARRAGDRWTFDGRSPGPELRVRQGEVVEVTLVNRDVEAGVTIHWHGVDVPNREDGVAGITQDAVMPGQRYTYRFRADQVGTFWYHSHQVSSEQVERGLYGALVILPRRPSPGLDLAVLAHDFDGDRVLDAPRRDVAPGTPVRLRVINTNSTLERFRLAGTPFRVAAIDGTDLNRPTPIEDRELELAGGGRYDLAFTMPRTAVRLEWRRGPDLVLGDGDAPRASSDGTFDPSRYGAPAPTGFGREFDREFEMDIDQRLGVSDQGFGYHWTINGRIYPDTPMYMVRQGDRVRMRIVNRTGADHPIHLHGHHMLVLRRNGRPTTGSPWWPDTLNVAPGERYDVAIAADNPGIWMDHCHNLPHARQGFIVHLAYEGVSTPFRLGEGSVNDPE